MAALCCASLLSCQLSRCLSESFLLLHMCLFSILFEFMHSVTIFSAMLESFPGLNVRIKCLAPGHNTVTPMRLEPGKNVNLASVLSAILGMVITFTY